MGFSPRRLECRRVIAMYSFDQNSIPDRGAPRQSDWAACPTSVVWQNPQNQYDRLYRNHHLHRQSPEKNPVFPLFTDTKNRMEALAANPVD
ncbi:MAG: hypothetical protein CMJ59_19680 [Planctomycetaceae bacterium]|nr:hypothetical protein [Planctomycetaceae bacterium]